MKFGQFVSLKKKKDSKNFTQTANLKLVPGPFVFAKNLVQPLFEIKFLKQVTYIRYIIEKLSKFAQIILQTSSDSILQRIL